MSKHADNTNERHKKKAVSAGQHSIFSIRHSALKRGFTMVEVVVMLSIITLLSGVVLFSFTGLNEGGALTRASRELALGIRRAQNQALAVRKLALETPTTKIPRAVGVRLQQNQTYFFLFGDINPNNNPAINDENFKYDLGEKIIDSTVTFDRNIKIDSVTCTLGTTSSSCSPVNILFSNPFGNVSITDDSSPKGLIIADRIEIRLKAPSGGTKTVTVLKSGQVSVQ